jgi:hypothetical protein
LQADLEHAAAEKMATVVSNDDRRELLATTVLRVSNSTAQVIADCAKEASRQSHSARTVLTAGGATS